MKGEIAVRYTIRHFDLPLLTFEANILYTAIVNFRGY